MIATHLLAFEGDPKVVWFKGNYLEYEEDRKKRPGAAANIPHRIQYRQLKRGVRRLLKACQSWFRSSGSPRTGIAHYTLKRIGHYVCFSRFELMLTVS